MSVEEQVKSHTRRVEAGEPIRYGNGCPHCPNGKLFHVHDRRSRTFRLIVAGCVKFLSLRDLALGLPDLRETACGPRFGKPGG